MIEHARFVNVGPFVNSDFTFSPYVNAIVGPNGSGKSTLVNGLHAAFTNDFSRFPEVKASLIRIGTERTDESYIEVNGTKNHQAYTVRRYLRGGKSFFRTKDVYVEGEDDVTTSILDFLSTNHSILDSCVFVAQTDIQSFLSLKTAARKKFLNDIYGLSFFESAHDALHKALNSVEMLATIDVRDIPDKLAFEELEAENLYKHINGGQIMLNFININKLRSDLAYYLSNETKQAQHAAASAKVELLEEQLAALNKEVFELQTDMVAAQNDYFNKESSSALVVKQRNLHRSKEATLSQIETYNKEIIAITGEIAHKEQQLAEIPAPSQERINELSDRLANLNTAIWGAAEFLEHSGTHDTKCTYCATEIADMEQALALAKQRHDDWIAEATPLHAEQQQLLKAKVARDRETSLLGFAHKTLQGLTDARAKLTFEEPMLSVEACDTFLSDLNKAHNAYHAAVTKCTDACVRQNNLGKQLDDARAVVASLNFHTDYKQHNPEELRKDIVAYENGEMQLTHWRAQYDELCNRIASYRKALDEAAKVEAANEKRRTCIEYLSALKSYCKYDCLPQQLSQEFLAQDCEDVNYYLDLLQAGFNIASNEKLEFSICFKNGKSHSEARLSPGQKTILAIAFLLAFNKKYAKDIRIMSLDEPTIWLDSERIKHLGVIISKMSEISRAESIQYLIVSHDDSLIQDADNVICTL
jgi:DNA repair exonuclease SbcCD ATPase subunit